MHFGGFLNLPVLEPRSLILYFILKCCNLPVFLLSNLFVVTEGQATFVWLMIRNDGLWQELHSTRSLCHKYVHLWSRRLEKSTTTLRAVTPFIYRPNLIISKHGQLLKISLSMKTLTAMMASLRWRNMGNMCMTTTPSTTKSHLTLTLQGCLCKITWLSLLHLMTTVILLLCYSCFFAFQYFLQLCKLQQIMSERQGMIGPIVVSTSGISPIFLGAFLTWNNW